MSFRLLDELDKLIQDITYKPYKTYYNICKSPFIVKKYLDNNTLSETKRKYIEQELKQSINRFRKIQILFNPLDNVNFKEKKNYLYIFYFIYLINKVNKINLDITSNIEEHTIDKISKDLVEDIEEIEKETDEQISAQFGGFKLDNRILEQCEVLNTNSKERFNNTVLELKDLTEIYIAEYNSVILGKELNYKNFFYYYDEAHDIIPLLFRNIISEDRDLSKVKKILISLNNLVSKDASVKVEKNMKESIELIKKSNNVDIIFTFITHQIRELGYILNSRLTEIINKLGEFVDLRPYYMATNKFKGKKLNKPVINQLLQKLYFLRKLNSYFNSKFYADQTNIIRNIIDNYLNNKNPSDFDTILCVQSVNKELNEIDYDNKDYIEEFRSKINNNFYKTINIENKKVESILESEKNNIKRSMNIYSLAKNSSFLNKKENKIIQKGGFLKTFYSPTGIPDVQPLFSNTYAKLRIADSMHDFYGKKDINNKIFNDKNFKELTFTSVSNKGIIDDLKPTSTDFEPNLVKEINNGIYTHLSGLYNPANDAIIKIFNNYIQNEYCPSKEAIKRYILSNPSINNNNLTIEQLYNLFTYELDGPLQTNSLLYIAKQALDDELRSKQPLGTQTLQSTLSKYYLGYIISNQATPLARIYINTIREFLGPYNKISIDMMPGALRTFFNFLNGAYSTTPPTPPTPLFYRVNSTNILSEVWDPATSGFKSVEQYTYLIGNDNRLIEYPITNIYNINDDSVLPKICSTDFTITKNNGKLYTTINSIPISVKQYNNSIPQVLYRINNGSDACEELNIKNSGDWGQVKSAKENKFLLLTGDTLCAAYCVMSNTSLVTAFGEQDKTYVLIKKGDLYKTLGEYIKDIKEFVRNDPFYTKVFKAELQKYNILDNNTFYNDLYNLYNDYWLNQSNLIFSSPNVTYTNLTNTEDLFIKISTNVSTLKNDYVKRRILELYLTIIGKNQNEIQQFLAQIPDLAQVQSLAQIQQGLAQAPQIQSLAQAHTQTQDKTQAINKLIDYMLGEGFNEVIDLYNKGQFIDLQNNKYKQTFLNNYITKIKANITKDIDNNKALYFVFGSGHNVGKINIVTSKYINSISGILTIDPKELIEENDYFITSNSKFNSLPLFINLVTLHNYSKFLSDAAQANKIANFVYTFLDYIENKSIDSLTTRNPLIDKIKSYFKLDITINPITIDSATQQATFNIDINTLEICTKLIRQVIQIEKYNSDWVYEIGLSYIQVLEKIPQFTVQITPWAAQITQLQNRISEIQQLQNQISGVEPEMLKETLPQLEVLFQQTVPKLVAQLQQIQQTVPQLAAQLAAELDKIEQIVKQLAEKILQTLPPALEELQQLQYQIWEVMKQIISFVQNLIESNGIVNTIIAQTNHPSDVQNNSIILMTKCYNKIKQNIELIFNTYLNTLTNPYDPRIDNYFIDIDDYIMVFYSFEESFLHSLSLSNLLKASEMFDDGIDMLHKKQLNLDSDVSPLAKLQSKPSIIIPINKTKPEILTKNKKKQIIEYNFDDFYTYQNYFEDYDEPLVFTYQITSTKTLTYQEYTYNLLYSLAAECTNYSHGINNVSNTLIHRNDNTWIYTSGFNPWYLIHYKLFEFVGNDVKKYQSIIWKAIYGDYSSKEESQKYTQNDHYPNLFTNEIISLKDKKPAITLPLTGVPPAPASASTFSASPTLTELSNNITLFDRFRVTYIAINIMIDNIGFNYLNYYDYTTSFFTPTDTYPTYPVIEMPERYDIYKYLVELKEKLEPFISLINTVRKECHILNDDTSKLLYTQLYKYALELQKNIISYLTLNPTILPFIDPLLKYLYNTQTATARQIYEFNNTNDITSTIGINLITSPYITKYSKNIYLNYLINLIP